MKQGDPVRVVLECASATVVTPTPTSMPSDMMPCPGDTADNTATTAVDCTCKLCDVTPTLTIAYHNWPPTSDTSATVVTPIPTSMSSDTMPCPEDTADNPADSCRAILDCNSSAPSGYY